MEISTHGSPVVMGAVVAAATGSRCAGGAAGRVHAAGVPQRQARSAAGRSRARPGRGGVAGRSAARRRSSRWRPVGGGRAPARRRYAICTCASRRRSTSPMRATASSTATATAAALTRLRDELRAIVDGGARARRLRDGHLVVVAGAPNVGKSSVFNALVGHERAIVTPVAGTTRDLVSEHVLVGDAHLRLVDTAGVRASAEVVEQEGIRRATAAAERCRSRPGGARSFARAGLGRSRRAGGDCRPSAADRRQQGRPGAGVGGGRSRRGAVDLGGRRHRHRHAGRPAGGARRGGRATTRSAGHQRPPAGAAARGARSHRSGVRGGCRDRRRDSRGVPDRRSGAGPSGRSRS